ncbi:amino acid ABC transporter permease [Lichenihabitans sp. Uapishka_5]|uniref:amino acid ABC transporter permease n=1 Tax=Lichenihabitans sp. Uapishka_5 TaxID=3037302 RepID=UPI0029E81928|nr:amino acid ABC transporter permease [Lichenihabitans sp. Uapishka_5]MDX7951618.1 amino acid ABC transporter permease [Lichenihabitans sp. Uapishka_5]
MTDLAETARPARSSALNDPKLRAFAYQALLVIAVLFLVISAGGEAVSNMRQRGIPLTFDFWNQVSGFDINQTLIPYTNQSTYGQAFWVGLCNTLLVAALGIVLATVIGFAVGIARLSHNWIVVSLASVYVEVLRNIPPLLVLLFIYNAVLKPLPNPKQSIALPGSIFLNNRGIIMPDPVFGAGSGLVALALVAGLLLSVAMARWARLRQTQTGKQFPILTVGLALTFGLPLLAYLVMGRPITFNVPVLKGFNFQGGRQIYPELAALLFGLSVYTASFIAEIVRAGIQSVHRGQSEAAHALGLPHGRTTCLVVVPQAMRVIIPPLTSEYLNLAKNSSLAVFIGYPDLVQVFSGTVLNQTGAAVQVMAITMAVYLTISLVTSFAMNLFNKRNALVER